MDILIEYIPILILSLISGLGGYLYNNDTPRFIHLISAIISSGIMGVILLLGLESIYPKMDLKLQYALVLLIVYFKPEKITEILEKWKRL